MEMVEEKVGGIQEKMRMSERRESGVNVDGRSVNSDVPPSLCCRIWEEGKARYKRFHKNPIYIHLHLVSPHVETDIKLLADMLNQTNDSVPVRLRHSASFLPTYLSRSSQQNLLGFPTRLLSRRRITSPKYRSYAFVRVPSCV